MSSYLSNSMTGSASMYAGLAVCGVRGRVDTTCRAAASPTPLPQTWGTNTTPNVLARES